jgi:FMN-dependent oxidoreductase (nitrilotriacetate monooxygenase family)
MGAQRILVNAFAMNCPTHLVAGTWRHPDSQAVRYRDLRYWTELAQLLERGLYDGLFIADVIGVYDVYGGGPAAALRAGVQVPVNDPLLLVSAMAHVTEHLGFGVTVSTSYEHPFILARRMSTLDHLTGGRVGWNVVTSYLNSGALNVGLDAQVPHDNRYEIADEYLEVVYKLWEGSWEDDAVVIDRERGIYVDPTKVHPIDHARTYFRVPGIHVAEPSPQRTPLLYQAGASSRGRRFAAEHAEAVFIAEPTEAIVARRIADLRDLAAAAGRDRHDVKVFTGFGVITGATRAEAQRKHDAFRRLADPEGMLALWSGWLGFDLAPYDLDDPLDVVPSDAIQSLAETFGDGGWRLRDVIDRLAPTPTGPLAVGTGAEVADRVQGWIAATDADGLNLWHVITPGTYADFAEYVVPELQRRGVYRTRYDEGTLREKLFGRRPHLPSTHRGARYRPAVTTPSPREPMHQPARRRGRCAATVRVHRPVGHRTRVVPGRRTCWW